MFDKLEIINKNGTLIFSAFDNFGSMSYPAAFDFVIGIDVSDEINLHDDEFIALKRNPVNVIIKNKTYRVKWIDGRNNIVKGSSFACAYYAGKFADFFLRNKKASTEKSYENFITRFSKNIVCNIKEKEKRRLQKCQIAVVFPFTKEIHSLAQNEDLLDFEVLEYCDIRQSGKVGIGIKRLLKHCDNNKIIQDVEEINWDDGFDVFILSYCDKYNRILGYDLKENIIEKCKKYNKYLVSFDNIGDYNTNELNYFYPYLDKNDIPYFNLGKLYTVGVPVLGVFGTSSKQGKFTLQLMLRRLFMNEGYKVAQIGTEPSSLLFGMDYVFPMGFHSTVYTKSNDNVIVLNEYMHQCEMKSPDIIIVGSQSGTCSYHSYNIKLFTLTQMEFLMGTQPDIVVVMVNVNDNLDYVTRTVKTIEGVVDCKVVSFVLFPRKMEATIRMLNSYVADNEYINYKMLLEKIYNIPVFSLNEKDVDALFKYIINYLS